MAKMSTLNDNFYSTSLDTSKWDASNSGATIAYTTTGVELRFRAATETNDSALIQTDVTYDLSDSYFIIKPEEIPSGTTSDLRLSIWFIADDNNYFYFYKTSAASTTWAYWSVVPGTATNGSVSFFPSATSWIKFSHSSSSPNSINLASSSDGATFTSRGNMTYTSAKTALQVRLQIKANASGTSPGTFKLSRANGQTQQISANSRTTTITIPTDLYFTRGPGLLTDSIESTVVFGDTTFMWDLIDQQVNSIASSSSVGSPSIMASPASATVYNEAVKPRTTYGGDVV
jgi:hypothetical protein